MTKNKSKTSEVLVEDVDAPVWDSIQFREFYRWAAARHPEIVTMVENFCQEGGRGDAIAAADLSLRKAGSSTLHPQTSGPSVSQQNPLANHQQAVSGPEWLEHCFMLIKALRPHQWVKNLLLFVPLLLAHQWFNLSKIGYCVLGFMAFCLCASATYLINDLRDVHVDRLHPIKRHRPFASGRLSAGLGIFTAIVFTAAGVSISFCVLSWRFAGVLLIYAATALLYSFYFKRVIMLDVVVLAGLYAIRVLAGGVAAAVPISNWCLLFSILLFTSLAFVKRYAELRGIAAMEDRRANGRGYEPNDEELVGQIGAACGCMSVVVLALYIASDDARLLYPTVWPLWLVCPLLLYWVGRLWFLARRGLVSEDPVVFALKDRTSYLVAGLASAMVVLAASV